MEGWQSEGWGAETYEQRFPFCKSNFGVGGDRTEHLLWRLGQGTAQGYTAELQPKALVLQIGTNNLGVNTAEQVVAGARLVVRTIRSRWPRAPLLAMAIFPRDEPGSEMRSAIEAINAALLEDAARDGACLARARARRGPSTFAARPCSHTTRGVTSYT